jgi:hypothetical protein
MKEYIVYCEFWNALDRVNECVEIRAYGFLRRHAEKAVRHDNPSLVFVNCVREA